jgi:hypothetical protein
LDPWRIEYRSMRSRRSVSWRPLFRRLIAVGALFAYLAAVNGLPLPPPVVIKDGGKPFPCQGHACGCQTAEECWRHCCCHTPEERWAWAKENHIQPPDYAEKPAAKEWRTTPIREQSESRQTASSSCPCCHGDGASATCRSATSHQSPTIPLGASTVSPLRCQGLTTQWVTTGVVPSEPPTLAPRPEPAAAGRIFPADFSAGRVALSPPFHPPRLPFSA